MTRIVGLISACFVVGLFIGLMASCSQKMPGGESSRSRPKPAGQPAVSGSESVAQQQGGFNLGQMVSDLRAGFTAMLGGTQTGSQEQSGVGNQSTIRVEAVSPTVSTLIGTISIVAVLAMWSAHRRALKSLDAIATLLQASVPVSAKDEVD